MNNILRICNEKLTFYIYITVTCKICIFTSSVYTVFNNSIFIYCYVSVCGYVFTVTEMQGYRIARLKAAPVPPVEEETEAEPKEQDKEKE